MRLRAAFSAETGEDWEGGIAGRLRFYLGTSRTSKALFFYVCENEEVAKRTSRDLQKPSRNYLNIFISSRQWITRLLDPSILPRSIDS
jgi:hypothetical protein